MELGRELEKLQEKVIHCRKCPRLVAYLQEVSDHRPKRFRDWDYWSKPLPSFGDPDARLLIVGLAPAANGGNRTGRMFTGDRSGEWLFEALHRFGFANRPNSVRRDDDFALTDCYITATIRCAPPDNKPLPEEIENCRPYFLKELDLLKNVNVVVPLGQIAFTQTLKCLRLKSFDVPPLAFGHGKIFPIRTPVGNGLKPFPTTPRMISLITTYHPSQQNTQTGRLTRPMFHKIFKMVKEKIENKG
ncbi:MAG: uracil-DNA glycosylase [Deltaproteobacteria bacterium RBG_16_49_23]|nr:MAG: uracil-DNA glycosylase [Deltaproteobacteria bacterium RBG_16_49_23]